MATFEDEILEKAVSLALRFLSYRPRSESEVRSRLRRRYEPQLSELVIERLREQGLLDDLAFARAWTQSRVTYRPRSAALIRRELLHKGVDREISQATVATLDDEENAYNAGLRAATSLTNADYATFYRRMWGYLHRRGFSQGVVRRTVGRLWEERRAGGQ